MNYLNIQVSSFLILLFAGFVIGFLFDFYRVFRGRIKTNPLIDFGGDLIFWLVALSLAAILIYWGTWLELRLYVWLVMGGGLILYFLFFSPIFIPLFRAFWEAAGWLPRQLGAGIWRVRNLLFRLRRLFAKGKSQK